jgi:hypothetical protein
MFARQLMLRCNTHAARAGARTAGPNTTCVGLWYHIREYLDVIAKCSALWALYGVDAQNAEHFGTHIACNRAMHI